MNAPEIQEGFPTLVKAHWKQEIVTQLWGSGIVTWDLRMKGAGENAYSTTEKSTACKHVE
jgi:hypothetical protein